ncbi:MAG TPA: M20/M25/M40 family metallo-hydrolase [Synergistaceae bacterium]|nr:M20/M25/M40 family metallo-hydrolase [Synergistaceae bacterium]HPJ25459.1 M20/M25/M40 family metallo-hydrolase [Synergistaceae bacterium]HPQ36722.1 M20/M25/M40 family metallo-hydrolase [Synergistaceae bacterium]
MVCSSKSHPVYKLLLQLVAIPSVSPGASEENRIARFLYDWFGKLPYFREHPEDLRLLPVEGDPLERHIVFALVRASNKTAKTVLLTGHMDVVNTDVYGPLKETAFQAEACTEAMKNQPLSEEARKDLDSGEWLFGRGVSDMKSGVASASLLLARASENPEELAANVGIFFVPDEENNSLGMLGAVRHLVRFQEQEGLEYVGCINTEPVFSRTLETLPTLYTGSIGKINPFFFCLGRETHVGEYYEGVSAGALISSINLLLDGNIAFSDIYKGQRYSPYGCHKIRDIRNDYSSTIAAKAMAYYGHLPIFKQPGEILEELRSCARHGLDNAMERLQSWRTDFWKSRNAPVPPREKDQVLSFEELRQIFLEEQGEEGLRKMGHFLDSGPSEWDERDRALGLTEYMLDECALEGPLVVFGFLPPFYPPRINEGKTPGDQAILDMAEKVRVKAKELGTELLQADLFEGVCDLSYCGFSQGMEELRILEKNTPAWGAPYRLPSEELVKLNIPICNLGPVGKDAHKRTERVHLPFLTEILPHLLQEAVDSLSGK